MRYVTNFDVYCTQLEIAVVYHTQLPDYYCDSIIDYSQINERK